MTDEFSRRLQRVIQRAAEGVDGIVVRVERPGREFSWSASCGEIGEVYGLHVHRGVDHTAAISLRHLLAHTSALPDDFSGRKQQRGEPALDKQLRSKVDGAWNASDAVRWARDDGALFAPGQGRSAFYSDTNHQLLGRAIEHATSTRYDDALEHGDVRALPERLGHAGIGTTQVAIQPDDQHLAKACDAAHPRAESKPEPALT